MRAGEKEHLEGLAKTGYCAALKRYFHGVREHLIFTPGGHILHLVNIPGNRHDVNGLYALLHDSFKGHLVGDNAYWPKQEKREQLAAKGVTITADARSNWAVKNTPEEEALLKERSKIERFIGLFDRQFHADRTLNHSPRHYAARRWTKAAAHNAARLLNHRLDIPAETYLHFRLAA